MQSPARRAIMIGMDGAAMELVINMVYDGHMPNLGNIIDRGVYRPMIGVFPTLTPPGWTATSTGAWPGNHGVMDFNIRKLGAQLDETVWGINTDLSRAEYLWNTVERAGGTPLLGQMGNVLAADRDQRRTGRRHRPRRLQSSPNRRLSPLRRRQMAAARNRRPA